MSRGGLALVSLLGVALVIFFVANAHLLYVALQSQPDCVPHVKTSGEAAPGGVVYGAAKSAC
ncbi:MULTISPECIES: hypothetical protein [unclassified Rhizobium]|nr:MULTISPECIES: hypothetical protein [unclassified Rhizobium]KQS88764.1 hypothetical protein ASG42_16160 [Rhizobium sp. Leaf391]KQT05707.1 hypothetical protein ASG50_15015 [Rhizobium sp. Leaf386]KQT91399.1 hypothetical protein ASG68_20065 [Rhizobium sp. Leaf453]